MTPRGLSGPAGAREASRDCAEAPAPAASASALISRAAARMIGVLVWKWKAPARSPVGWKEPDGGS